MPTAGKFFSKVIALVYSLYKVTILLTFQISCFYSQHEDDATIDDDGLPTLTREKSKAQVEQKAVDKQEIENYKKHNPEFKKQMDEVHGSLSLSLCARDTCTHTHSLSLTHKQTHKQTHTHTHIGALEVDGGAWTPSQDQG